MDNVAFSTNFAKLQKNVRVFVSLTGIGCFHVESWLSKLDDFAQDFEARKVQIQRLETIPIVQIPNLQHGFLKEVTRYLSGDLLKICRKFVESSNLVVREDVSSLGVNLDIVDACFMTDQNGCWLGRHHRIPQSDDLVVTGGDYQIQILAVPKSK